MSARGILFGAVSSHPCRDLNSARLHWRQRGCPLDLRLRPCAPRPRASVGRGLGRAWPRGLISLRERTTCGASRRGSYESSGKEGEGVLVAALQSEREERLATERSEGAQLGALPARKRAPEASVAAERMPSTRLTGNDLKQGEKQKAASRWREAAFSPGGPIRPPRADAWFAAAPRFSSC
jgi:hypothetical protein